MNGLLNTCPLVAYLREAEWMRSLEPDRISMTQVEAGRMTDLWFERQQGSASSGGKGLVSIARGGMDVIDIARLRELIPISEWSARPVATAHASFRLGLLGDSADFSSVKRRVSVSPDASGRSRASCNSST